MKPPPTICYPDELQPHRVINKVSTYHLKRGLPLESINIIISRVGSIQTMSHDGRYSNANLQMVSWYKSSHIVISPL